MEAKVCKNCSNRKDKMCVIKKLYVARKSSCDEFKPKKGK